MIKFPPFSGPVLLRAGVLQGLLLLGGVSVPSTFAQAPAVGLHYGSDFSLSQYNAFGDWLGKKVMYRVTFLEKTSWATIRDATLVDMSKKWINSHPGRVEVISTPLFPDGDSSTNFSDLAGGARDGAFRSFAQKIQKAGIADKVIIRLGWEGNGGWYKWSYLKNPSGFRAAYRRIVSVMRGAAPKLRFEFNISNLADRGSDGAKWTAGYPGDDVVDVISMDIYDHWHTWNSMMHGDAGLYEMRKFAEARGKPEAYSEWACSTTKAGNGDNPDFIKKMADWMEARPWGVLYQAYWNTKDGANALVYGANPVLVPKVISEYRSRFGALKISTSSTNTAPWISSIPDKFLDINGSTGAVSFTVGDKQTAAGNLKVTANVSDPALVPVSHIVLSGSGSNRTVTVRPVNNKTGWSTIWLKVSDGQLTSTTSFVVQASATLTFQAVGTPAIEGSHTWSGSKVTVRASGNDIYRNRDNFHFGSSWLSGDAEMTVKVSSLTRTDGWTKAGLMFRSTGAADSAFVGAYVTPSNGLVLQWRSKNGGYASSSTPIPGTAPKWLRLMRSGDSFYAFHSTDGNSWHLIDTTWVDLPYNAMAGVALVSHAPNKLATAEFDKFSID